MYNQVFLQFQDFIKQFNLEDEKINIVYNHTLRVVRLMEKLAKYLKLDEEDIELAKVIGLLHDIGRFKEINKFKDSTNYLFLENHIRDFITTDKYDKIIYFAILNNSLEIDKCRDEKSIKFAKMISDMDSVDIFRVLASFFEYELKEEDVSLELLNDFNNGKAINHEKIKNKSEEVLSYLSRVFDINYKESFEILYDSDNLELFIGSLNISKYNEEFASTIFKKVRNIVDKNID
jgi:putative nucleotidyltransferase with HDIG domain